MGEAKARQRSTSLLSSTKAVLKATVKSLPQLQSLKGRKKTQDQDRGRGVGAQSPSALPTCSTILLTNNVCTSNVRKGRQEANLRQPHILQPEPWEATPPPPGTSEAKGRDYLPKLLPVQNSGLKRLSAQRDGNGRKQGKPDAREEGSSLQKAEVAAQLKRRTRDSRRRPAGAGLLS